MERKRTFVTKLRKISESDVAFDLEFWAQLGPAARFAAAWEMVCEVDAMRGGDGHQPRLQRSVENLQRIQR